MRGRWEIGVRGCGCAGAAGGGAGEETGDGMAQSDFGQVT